MIFRHFGLNPASDGCRMQRIFEDCNSLCFIFHPQRCDGWRKGTSCTSLPVREVKIEIGITVRIWSHEILVNAYTRIAGVKKIEDVRAKLFTKIFQWYILIIETNTLIIFHKWLIFEVEIVLIPNCYVWK